MLPVLDGIDFVVNPGEILSVVGKSGCGKTTLLNILSGLLEPTEGWVSHAGTLGYVSQKDLLLPWRNIIENILLPLEIRHSLDATSVLRARELLRQFGLETFAAAYPHEISGGMRQKVSLIRSFMQDPKIFLLDEPFSAIDSNARMQMAQLFRDYVLSSGKSAVFVTHNIEEAISVGDMVMVLGSRPARILYQAAVHVPEVDRKPTLIRKTAVFDEIFEQIWTIMSTP